MIWRTIAQPSDMVGLKIGTAVFACEGRHRAAAFALVSCTSQNIVTNVAAALMDIANCACSRPRLRGCCGQSFCKKTCQINLGRSTSVINDFGDRFKRPELKHYRAAVVSLSAG